MKKYAALVVTLLLVAAHVRAQVSGIAGYLLVGRSTVAAMPAAASVVRGLWIVTDDADCDASTADDGVTVCVDEGATWAALTGSGGGGAPDPHATTHQDGGSDEIDVTGLLGLLGTAQTPAAHTQAASTISDSTAAGRTLLTAADATAQRTALGLGTSAVLNVPAAGNAAVGEVVKGDDTRLTDARTPTSTLAHASSHQHSGTDEVATATPGANAIPKAGAGGTIAAGWVPTLNQSTTGNAASATALAADPADCGVNQFGTAIAASGDLTCAAIADADVPDTITASNYAPLAGATFTGSVAIDNAQIFKLFEADANGSNFFALVAPASFTGDVTCTIGADGKIPDSCVGDGTDASGGAGDVVGPASSTDNTIARYDLTTGKLIQESSLAISDEAAGLVTLSPSSATTNIALNVAGKGTGQVKVLAASRWARFTDNGWTFGFGAGGTGSDNASFYCGSANDCGILAASGNSQFSAVNFVAGGAVGMGYGAGYEGIAIDNSRQVAWSGTGTQTGTKDVILTRASAGVMKLSDALRLNPRSSPPVTCGAGSTAGTIYYDSDSNEVCACNGTAWTGLIAGGSCA